MISGASTGREYDLVKMTLPSILLMALILLCTGCMHGRLLVCVEQPFWATLGEDLPTRVAIAKEALLKGFVPEFRLIAPQENPLEALKTALSARRFAAVIVGPLLSFQAGAVAVQHPSVDFILLEAAPLEDALANTIQLVFDRSDAFRATGRIAGLSLRQAARSSSAEQAASLASRIGILMPASRRAGDRGIDAFQSGLAESLGEGLPLVVRIDDPIDQEKVKKAVSEMRSQGVEIVFSRLSGFDPYCLVALKESGGSAIVSDWEASQAFPGQVFLSVEDDILAGMALCLDAIGGTAAVVRGPVRIVCGKARSLPKESKDEVDCR